MSTFAFVVTGLFILLLAFVVLDQGGRIAERDELLAELDELGIAPLDSAAETAVLADAPPPDELAEYPAARAS